MTTGKQSYSHPSLLSDGVRVRCFRRFCRKGYAVFSSLHREVRIGVLTVGMLSSVNIPKTQAMQVSTHPDDEGDGNEKELAEVSVAGTMAPLTALQSARIVGVITRQQIEASAAQSVNDLLKSAVGVDVRQRGGFGIQTDISINGCTFDQITILLNGVNISSPHTGHLAADFPVTLSDIERIEILEGAASRVYGASAFGGAINVVTKRLTPNPSREGGGSWRVVKGGEDSSQAQRPQFSCDAGVQGGSYMTFGGDARIALTTRQPLPSLAGGVGGGSAGSAGASFSASYLRSNGATTNSDFQKGNAYFQGYYDAPDFSIDLQAGYSQKGYGANTFYSAAYPNQYERNRRLIVSLGAETKGRVRLKPEVYWNRLYDNFELIRDQRTGENFHRSDAYGARVTASIQWAAGRTAVGAEVREEGIYSTALGQLLHDPQRHKVPGEELYYTRHDSRTNLSFNAEHTILLPHFTASIGVLGNYNTRFDSHLRFYPGLDLAYTPSSHWRLYASYNKGFRLPTFTDLYYKSPTHEGNQGMKAEESHSFQVGLKHQTQGPKFHVQSMVKAFYHRGTNLIDWVMYSADDVFHSANFDLDNMGVQAQVTFGYLPSASYANGQGWVLNLSYAFIHQHRRDAAAVYKSNYAMEYLRHKLVVRLDHPIWSHLTASWNFRWQDRMGDYILYENAQSTGRLVPYSPYATLDLKVRWTARRYEVWAEATNLTNHTYYDLGNIPQPGIVVMGGVRLHL